ncbi:MAG: hypothetical protein K6F73_08865 [Lachnospiraceae bacterium]|nr:hypothetical protein [Lachnospiraceae bacterium]
MSKSETLSALLPLFTRYYNVDTENAEPPFVAEAVFSSHNEQYYLIKAAKVADINMYEYVYFAECDTLGADDLRYLDETAWERGLAKVTPETGHRSSDVTLIIVADTIEDDTKKKIRKMRHYKSYKWGMHGWSNYRLVAIECSSGKAFYNHQGQSLKKLVSNIL